MHENFEYDFYHFSLPSFSKVTKQYRGEGGQRWVGVEGAGSAGGQASIKSS